MHGDSDLECMVSMKCLGSHCAGQLVGSGSHQEPDTSEWSRIGVEVVHCGMHRGLTSLLIP